MANKTYIPSYGKYSKSSSSVEDDDTSSSPSTKRKDNLYIPSYSNYSKAVAQTDQQKIDEMKKKTDAQKKKGGGNSKALDDVIKFVKQNVIDPVVSSVKTAGNVTGAVGTAAIGAVKDRTAEEKARTKEASLNQFNKTPFGKIAGVKEGDDGKLIIPKKNAKDEAKMARQIYGQTAEDTLNIASVLPAGGAARGAKLAVQGGKQAVRAAGHAAAEGAAYGAGYGGAQALQDDELTLGSAAKDVGTGAAFGGVAGGLIGGLGATAGKLASVADKKAGQVVEKVLSTGDAPANKTLTQIGEKGVVGGLNSALSDAGKAINYRLSDMLGKTTAGKKIIDAGDSFMSKWVTELHPLYKELKRSDFEGKTTGAYLAAREAVGNSNRALSFAAQHIETDPGIRKTVQGIESRGVDPLKTRQQFDEYAKVRSELELAAAGKKEFSENKLAELTARGEKLKADGHDFNDEYKGLVEAYSNLNDFRLQQGLISKEDHARFKNDPYDYIRQQREIPQWMQDKPGAPAGAGGSKLSITKSAAVQKRNRYAAGEQLSPLETYQKTVQNAYVEAYRNQAAKTVYGLLDQAGEAKLLRSTDVVREKQGLLQDLHESKPIVTKLNKVLRSNKTQAVRLQKALNELNRKGVALRTNKAAQREATPEFDTEMLGRLKDLAGKSGNTRELVRAMITEDPKGLRQIRNMIENRDAKLTPLLDQIELMGRDLADLHAERAGIWNRANSLKTTVDKKGMTSLSFLDDGVENVVKIDPSIASAIHNWDQQSQNVMTGVLRVTNNIFKYGTTGINAGFALPNFIADQVGSSINSKSLAYTHNPKNFIHALFMTIGRPLDQRDAELLAGYTGANKGQLTINQYEKAYTAERAANELIRKNAGKIAKTYTVIRHPREGMRALFGTLKDVVGSTEELTRIQNYRGTANKAAKEGAGAADQSRLANQAARENSVDFLEMGSYGRVVNGFIPYFNASIQGSRTMLRNAAERPASFAAKTTALVTMPVALSTMWNVMDPGRKGIYDTIPDYVKETNFVVIAPNATWNDEKNQWDGVFLMKKPPGLSQMAEPARRYIEYASSNDPTLKQTFADFLQNEGQGMAGDLLSGLGPVNFTDPNKFLSSVTPQILKPTAEAILNKTFFTGKDIVPESLQGLPPEEQKYSNYSMLTSAIAGQFGTSPLKVDQWIRDTFGEVGTNAINTGDRLMGAPKEAQGGRAIDESVSRRFYGAPGGADTDEFYKNYNPASAKRKSVSKEITSLIQGGQTQKAKRMAEEYNASLNSRFDTFFSKYKDSPNYNPDWDEQILGLQIPVTNRGFAARANQK